MLKFFNLNPGAGHLVNAVSATGLFIPQSVRGEPAPTATGIVAHLGVWMSRIHQRSALARLDDRSLNDMGLTRSEALVEADKPFWRD